MTINARPPAWTQRLYATLNTRLSVLTPPPVFVQRVLRITLWGLALLVLLYALIPRPPLWEGLSYSSAYYDREQRLLRLTLSADDKYRLRLPLSQIAPAIIDTTLLYEDRHFYRHPGVNPYSLVRAAFQSVTGARRIGGSTLTMQLARIRFHIDSRSVTGKLEQIARALQIELFYSKNEILEAYLGLAPYGGNVEGIGAASLIYFGKPASRLTLAEALSLSVIPQSPARRVPGNAALDTARDLLVQKWIDTHPQAAEGDLLRMPLSLRAVSDLPFRAPHFVDALNTVQITPGEIHTTLDMKLQALLERQTQAYLTRRRGQGLHNAVALLLDYRSMEVRALLGSADFFDDSIQGQVNGVRARRSPGSALKPFIYALGMDQGLVHPLSMLKDAPARFGGFNPENFDREFAGPISVHDALIRSRNLPAVQVAMRLRQPGLYGFMQQAQVALPRSEDYYGLALALGGAEVSMEELVQLYATLANGGRWQALRYLPQQARDAGVRLLSAEASFLVLDILKDNPRPAQGYRGEWARESFPVYWKTGTSYGFRDAWSVGIFGPYVLAVWTGNFDGTGNPALVGVEAAAPLLFSIIDGLRAEGPPLTPFYPAPPPDLAQVRVCAVSGQIPGRHCRHTQPTWFTPGVSPIGVCDIHRAVSIDVRSGRRACRPGAAGTRTEVFEYWPSDLLRLFRQAGIPRRSPPAENPDCPLEVRAARGNAPQITSPQAGLAYSYRAGERQPAPLSFSAVTDADVQSVYWFLDERFVGRSDGGRPLFWSPRPGQFMLRAVDDQGRSDARAISVQVIP